MHDEHNGAAEGQDTGARHVTVRQRHAEMIRMVRETGFATIQSLADHFGITPQSVRRDINTLNAKGLVQRYHGGAGPCLSTENLDYLDRKVLCLAEKRIIGQMVAEVIPNKSSLFINIGTTTEEVARLSGGKVPSASEMDSAEADLKRAEADEAKARAAVSQAQADLHEIYEFRFWDGEARVGHQDQADFAPFGRTVEDVFYDSGAGGRSVQHVSGHFPDGARNQPRTRTPGPQERSASLSEPASDQDRKSVV